ncbi:MAG: sporulation integral membrane protein YlbJ [Clostridia bacterium]|nr:sporulation integral membrane protein YlbJ [Clostridia bacterium]
MIYLLLFLILCIIFITLPSSKVEMKVVKLKRYLMPMLIFCFLILLVIFSKSSFESAHTGFMLWVNNVVPSLLPFLIGIELMKRTNFMQIIGKLLEKIMRPVFNVPGCGAFALAMGMSSGYPVGSKIVASLREEKLCSKVEAERLLSFTNTSGPIFIVGAVGIGMFGDAKIGLMLLLTHFFSALLVGVIFRNYKANSSHTDIVAQKPEVYNNNASFSLRNLGAMMGESIKSAINTLLLICGYIVFFAVLGDILQNTGIMHFFQIMIERFLKLFDVPLDASNGIARGILEVTSGVKALSSLKNISYLKLLSVVAFVLGFGGFSVHMQTASIIADTDLSLKPYLFAKLLHGIFASVSAYLLMKYTTFFNWDVVETFSYHFTTPYPAASSSNLLLIVVTTLCLTGIGLQLFHTTKKG